jgi:hypothetical protein
LIAGDIRKPVHNGSSTFDSSNKKNLVMKKVTLFFLFVTSFSVLHAQGLKGLIKKVSKDSSVTKVVSQVPTSSKGLSNDDIIGGLKEALTVGANNSANKLSMVDGFFKDAALKIMMPEEAKKVEQTLRSLGQGALVDQAILSMNRAAEDAAGGVANIFLDAIKGMTVTDGLKILQGGDFAATNYLKSVTTKELTEKFRPVIEASLVKVDATKYWKDLFTTYNRFSSNQVNTDLTAYVTERALSGLFYNIGLEEQKIRKDPAAQVTDILKKVFGGK